MPHLRLLLLLSCVGLSHACIEVPPIEDPVGAPQPDPNADFTFTAVPSQEQVLPGDALGCEVQLTWVGAEGGDVAMSLVGPPEGIQLQPFTLSSGKRRATLSIGIGTSTMPGTYSLTLEGRSGAVTKQATLAVTVGKAGDLVVNWIVPTPGKAFTNGPLLLQFTVGGGTAEAVEILKDASVLAKPSGTPYAFTWDTTQEAEGTYQLSIRAIRDGAIFLSTPRTVTVDRTAPTVSSFLPVRNAAAVGVRESIQVTFSEPMNPLSVTEELVRLTTSTGAPIPKTVSLSVDGKTLTATPVNPLAAPDTVSVDLSPVVGLITDLAGNMVGSASEWAFTVPTWLPLGGAISAVAGPTSAEGVVLKMDRDDQPVVAWAESDGTNKNIYVARWTGAAWTMLGAPLSGLVAVGTDAAMPTLAIESTGEPVVAWEEKTGNGDGRTIFVRRWTGTTWAALPSPPFPTGQAEYPSKPRLTIDTNKNINIFADFYDSVAFSILGYTSPPQSQTWQDRKLFEDPYLFNPSDVSATSSGPDTFVAASVFNDHDSTRGIAVFKNDTSPLGNRTLGRSASTPSITIDGNGYAWVAWTELTTDPQSDGQIHWARWEGTTWSPAASISTGGTGNTAPSLALAQGGPHILAWSGIVASERSILVSQWINNSWQPLGAPLNASTVAGTPAMNPSVDLNATAQPFIAWTEPDPSVASIHVVRINR
ncbi:Ig-like domain-containing protein [Corallococcus sicarius]|uniref:SbsA Ig-like domain-containing protein n=1 Tax=Corallococcus sicarius TaxID=2316726 RepID=A0A3A8NVD2_9BACT|nr:Ig-like domain-containing protein [Corallococcus sicarius]RKH48043.1 hypothetical protein D7X12_01050 [Corallococcus sicarius]